ncbi:hypothetical protein HYY74_03395 [Candidatus Woesearchaeota archaeon]|nr:hypothetical protein [Candidatus Woesearchaeota archaeon]
MQEIKEGDTGLGFLKFLKKGEAKQEVAADHLDIPPPPQMGSFGTELPTFPGPSMAEKGLEIPSFDAAPAIAELPEIKPFSYDEYEKSLNQTSAEPQMARQPIIVPQPPQAVMGSPPQMPAPIMPELQKPEIEYKPAKHAGERAVFIEASTYREVLEYLDSVHAHKESENKANDARDSEYAKMADCLEDIQRKLMDIDEKLFEV